MKKLCFIILALVTAVYGQTINGGATCSGGCTSSSNGNQAPQVVITSGGPPNGQTTVPYSFTFTASGGTLPYAWSVISGTLPTSLSLNSASGVLSGTPTVANTFTFTVQVTDANGLSANAPYSVTIAATIPALVITSGAPPNGTKSAPYTFTFTASGGVPPYSFAVLSGTIPTGLSLNSSTGVLSGTPTVPFTYTFTIQVTDSASTTANGGPYTVIIAGPLPLTITNAIPPGGTVGSPYNFALTATGGVPPYTWSISFGALPTSLSLAGSTGIISGTPTVSASFGFTVKVTDSASTTATAPYTVFISPASTVQLPQLWVNYKSCNPPGGTYDVTKTVKASGGNYAGTLTGLNTAVADWVAAGDEWEHLVVDAGLLISGASPQISIGAKAGATKCLVIESSNPIPVGSTACSGGITDSTGSDPGTRNPGCTNNTANLYILDWNPASFSTNPIILFQPGSNHVVIRDAEIRLNFGNNNGTTGQGQSSLITVGVGSITSASLLPNVVGFDGNYIHGCDGGEVGCSATGNNMIKAVQFNCTFCWFTNNYIEKSHQWASDAQAFGMVNTTGPVLIEHNWIEGGSEGLFSGGQTPALIPYSVPSDIAIIRNRVSLDPNWVNLTGQKCGGPSSCPRTWSIKNRIELKLGQRILEDGNIVEYSWNDGQTGALQLMNLRACSGNVNCTGNEGAVDQDITRSNNIFRHSAELFENDARSDDAMNGNGVSLTEQRILDYNNLAYDVVNFGQWSTSVGSSNNQGFANGNFGNQFTATASGNGTAATLTITGFTSSLNGTWNGLIQMFAGDPLLVTNCANGAFDTPQTLAIRITSVTQAFGATTASLTYPSPATGATTGCQLSNKLGWHNAYTMQHNAVYGGNVLRYMQMAAGPIFPRNITFMDNITVSEDLAGGFSSGVICFGPTLQEGTKSEACWDLTTFQFNHDLLARNPTLYTEYPSGIVGNAVGHTNGYVATITCSGNLSTADPTCPGLAGFLSGAVYPPANFSNDTFDYHGFQLCTANGAPTAACHGASSYAAAASDGTQMGPNIPNIDTAQDLTTYVCGTPCGSGPYPFP